MTQMIINLEGGVEANRFLQKAIQVISDYTKPLSMIGDAQLQTIAKQFSSEGAEMTSRWQSRKDNLPHPILNKTGKLKGSFQRTKLTKTEVEISSKNPYFPFHQLGTRRMPQRRILGFNEKMADEAIQIIMNYIRNQLRLG